MRAVKTMMSRFLEKMHWTLLLLCVACGAKVTENQDGQTHWLELCDSDSECGADLQCVCGACVAPCAAAANCSVTGKSAECVGSEEPAVLALCAESSAVALCLEPCGGNGSGTCAAGEACFAGQCIPEARATQVPPVTGSGDAGNSTGGPGEQDAGIQDAGTQDAGTQGSECGQVPLESCEESGCQLFRGYDLNYGLNRRMRDYACDAPQVMCPEGSCAVDPANAEQVVWFIGCAPPDWELAADPNTCDRITNPDCSTLGELGCRSTPECEGLYGTALDGSGKFAGCVAAGTGGDGALTCARSPHGALLRFPTTTLPSGWVATALAECEPDCASPWRNPQDIGGQDVSGCPCEVATAACVEGVGFGCEDLLDDVRFYPSWMPVEQVCAASESCANAADYFLQECTERFRDCRPSGSIVLDEGTLMYCGTDPLPCAARGEATCDGECQPLFGTVGGVNRFAACVEQDWCAGMDGAEYCVQRSALLPPVYDAPLNEPVLLQDTCLVPVHYQELELDQCIRNPF